MSSPEPDHPERHRPLRSGASWRWLQGAVTAAFLVVLGASAFFYQAEEASARRKVHDNLDVVSSLKVAQIVQWRRELLGDAEDIASQPHLIDAVGRWLRRPTAADQELITTSLSILKRRAGLSDAMIVDATGRLRLSLERHLETLDGEDVGALAVALAGRHPVLTGLHHHPEDAQVHVDVLAPLVSAAGQVVGAVLLETRTADLLDPMLRVWPTASRSSETLLVRRVGDAVEFLNTPKHSPEAALRLRLPLDRTAVPAVNAVLGREGIFEGLDYRGEPVVSVLRPVPESPWFLVTKTDTAEAYADWHARSRLLMLLMTTLAVSTLVGLLWIRRSAADYQELSRAEADLWDHKSHLEEMVARRTRELEERNRMLAIEIIERNTAEQALRESQADLTRAQAVGTIGSWRMDIVNNRLTWSPENHRIFGVPEGVAMTYQTFLDVVHPDDRDYVDRMWAAALAGKGEGDPYDIEHRLLVGGQVKWVRERAELEFAADGKLLGGFGTTQDITERKLAEARLQAANERLAGLAAERAAHLRVLAGELTRAEQRERDRLYELLHDEVQPLLVAARLALSGINENSSAATCARVAVDTRDIVSKVIATARTLSAELSPPLIRERGLVPALDSLGRLMASQYGLAVDLACDPDAEPADMATRLLCFNAVRELLLNAVKHAGTGAVDVSLQLEGADTLRIAVVDRGQGFDAAAVGNGVGSGLASIERRLGMIGGRLAIESTPGKGTTALLWAPMGPAVGAEGRKEAT